MDTAANEPHRVRSPTSVSGATDPGPLSPDLVASLQLNLSWLDLRGADTPTSASASGSGAQTPSSSAALAGPSSPAATTLAQRRMHRPPMFRRRSKSLDDVDADEVEGMMDSLLDEHGRDLEARAAVRAQAAQHARDQLVPRPPPSARSATASLAESQATSMPTSVTSSSLSTLGGGGGGGPGGSWTASRGGSEPAPVPAATASGLGNVVLRLPSGAGSLRSSGPPTSSEDRLASWVRSTSQDSLSGPALPPSPLPPPSPTGSSRGIRLPSLPPRQPYTPVLPSPLSTCSYTSNDDDDGDRDRGFPFPATIHDTSLTPETDDTSRAQSLRSSSSPPKSAPATAVPSPGDEGDSPRRLPAFAARPAFQSFASGSTVSASTPSTVSGTPTAQPPPLPARAADAHRSPPTLTRNPTPSTSSIDFAAVPSPAAAASPPSSSSAIAIAAAARTRSHTQGTSTSSQSHSHSFASSSYQHRTAPASGSDSRSRPPLTPPDGISSGPWQHNASAAELAWHDVLSARFGGAGGGGGGQAAFGAASAAGGSDSSAGSGAPFAFSGAAALAALGADGAVRPRLHETGSWGASTGAGTGGAGGGAGGAGGGGGGAGKKGGWQGNELMGNAAAGTYAARTKDALAELLAEHVDGVPLDDADETVHVVEYGALNSRSCALVSPVIEHFAEREAARIQALATVDPDDLLSFQVTHADQPDADFRCLSAYLDADPDSYLRKSRADLGLDGRIFSTFAARPSGVKVLPKKSVSVGFSAMSLHWPSTDRKYRVAPATLAHGELMAFLSARASEFKPGGLLTLAYIARSEEAALAANSPGTYSPSASGAPSPAMGNSPLIEPASATSGIPHAARSPALPLPERTTPPGGSPASTSPTTQVQPRKKDVWAHLTSVLGKAIQRLVSTGLLKPQVARQLLALPLHPRTPRQTQACLRASAHSWDVLDSSVVVMSHPAWTGVEHGTVAIESWADQTIQVVKTFWEDEMRSVLRNALGSRGACEWVLDCLWTVAKEKIEEQPPHPLDLEVQLVALRRRERPASVPSSPVEGAQHKLPLGVSAVDVMKRVDEIKEGASASSAAP
ncbi:hypothetical protein JCM8208_000043 [Rhodotorula glutinis]